MKKIFLCLLLIACLFVTACSETICQHRDANDDSLCDKCGDEYKDGTDICQHRDVNDDSLCDKCGAEYEDGKDVFDTCQHRDADDNEECDECGESYTDGKDLPDEPVCQHRDADDNEECDECGESYTDGKDVPDEPVCQHRDADDDGECDECGESYTDGKDLPDYRITSIKINGVDLKGYNIVVLGVTSDNAFADDYNEAAENLQSMLYSDAGYQLPIENSVGEKSIVFAAVEDAGEDGFRVVVRENVLYIECAYHNAFLTSFEEFLASNLSIKQGDVNFASSFSFTKEVNVVRYKDFGAKGNGLDNDFYAIKAAHDYANDGGQKVVADRGTYLINKTGGKLIIIKTDTDWTNAKFILDDRNIVDNDPEIGGGIFEVKSDYKPVTFTPDSAGKAGQTIRDLNASAASNGGLVFDRNDTPTIDLGLGYAAMLVIYNQNQKVYIRYGGNANNGDDQHEMIMVDENGVSSEETSILIAYTEITKIVAYRADDKPVTVTGGEFTTRANQCMETGAYFRRGIVVTRPNTTITGLKHYITDEGDHGNPYTGWLRAEDTCNVVFENCILTGHRVYIGPGTYSPIPQGTYDTGAENACNITWKNVKQSNFFHLDKNGNETSTLSTVINDAGLYYWGIMSSSYTKNLTYDGCKLTCLDAHAGTKNATIKDSEVAWIAMIGGGLLNITNSIIYDTFDAVVVLRDDYGSVWDGDVIIKDVTFKILNPKHVRNNTVSLIIATYTNHYFGYKAYLPHNVYVDNFRVDTTETVTKVNILYGSASTHDNINNPNSINPQDPIKYIEIKNNNAGYEYIHPNVNSASYADTVMTIIPKED